MKPKRTPPGRISFPSLYEMNDYGQKKKNEVTLLFPPDVDLSEMKTWAAEVAREEWGDTKVKSMSLVTPFRDCGEKSHIDGYEEGWTFVRFATTKPFKIVGPQLQNMPTDDGTIYPGCWGICGYSPYAWTHTGRSGVSFTLRAFQFVRKDTPLGGTSINPEELFQSQEEDFTPFDPGSDDFASLL